MTLGDTAGARETGPDGSATGRGSGRETLRAQLRRWGASLSFRLALLMSLALVPLGLIGVSQTDQLQRELDRTRLLNLQVVTTDIARREGEAIDTAFGAAAALAATFADGPGTPARCIATLERLSAMFEGRISFAAFVPEDGQVDCATVGAGMDFTTSPDFDARMARRQPFITSSDHGPLSRAPVVTVFQPVTDPDGVFRGLVALSVVDRGPMTESLPAPNPEMIDYVVVSATGTILATSVAPEEGADLLPASFVPARLPSLEGLTFLAEDPAGTVRRFAVAEAVSEAVYIVGSEPADRLNGWSRLFAPESFPLFMWVASVVLIFVVLESSLVGPVRTLAGRMRGFGETRRMPQARRPLPSELRGIETAFDATARRLMREEADLTDALYDRDVLLKEVHHRVKNNLQMISSMLNLQIREESDPRIEETLEKVSGRIASLAAVHRQVYAAERPGAVRADELLREVCVPLSETVLAEFPAAARPDLVLDLDPVRLTPDQAVPAAMLVVEALTTALRWCAESGAESEGAAREVRVSLADATQADDPDGRARVRMRIASTPDFDVALGDGSATTTLGERLIRGFARQLRGTLDITWDDGVNAVTVGFLALPFSPEVDAEDRAISD